MKKILILFAIVLALSNFVYSQVDCPPEGTSVILYLNGPDYNIWPQDITPPPPDPFVPCPSDFYPTLRANWDNYIYVQQFSNAWSVTTSHATIKASSQEASFRVDYGWREQMYWQSPDLTCQMGITNDQACGTGVQVTIVDFKAISASASYCVNASSVNLQSLVTPNTGFTITSTGTGVTGGRFYPNTAGVGTHNISITGQFSNGNKTIVIPITVTALPEADLSFIPSQTCSGTTINLTGSPTISNGGTLQSISLDGSNVSFNFPWTTTAGAHTVVYTVNNSLCGNITTTKNVQVGTNYTLTANANYSLCEGGPLNLSSTTPPTVPGGVTGTGAWSMVSTCAGCLSGTTFTPPDIAAGANVNYDIRYSYTGSAGYLGCNKSVDKVITVKPKTDLSFLNTSIQTCAQGSILLNVAFVPRGNGTVITPTSWNVGSLSSYYTAADMAINAGGVVVSGSQQTFPLSISYTNAGGCSSTSSNVNLILDKIPNAPTNANTAAELKACSSGTFTLKASGAAAGESYVWRNEGGVIVGGSTSTYSAGTLGVGTYYFTAAIKGVNGCEGNRTNYTINVYPNPAISATSASLSKCTGTYTINLFTEYGISTSGSGTNNWTSTNSTISTRLNATTGALTMGGIPTGTNYPVTYKFTSAEGCTSTLSLTLNVSSGVATPVVADVKNCEVGAANLSVSNVDANATYNWYDAASAGNLIGTGSGYTTPSLTAPQNSSQSYSYYVSASSSSCTSPREEVVVTVVNTDQVIAGVDLSFCDNTGKISDLRGAASPAGGTFSGTGVTYVGVTPVFNCGSSCGLSLLPNNETYTITYTYTNSGCNYSSTRDISLGFKPVITITPEVSASAQEVKIGEYVKIEHNYADATETTWTFVGEGTGAVGNPAGHIYYQEGYKTIDVTIKRAGCTGSFSATNVILVEPDPFDIITGSEDPLEALKGSDVYPNPMDGALVLESKTEMQAINFVLMNSLGSGVRMKQMNISQGRNEIFDASAIDSLPPGVYFLKVAQGDLSFSLKLLKR